MINIVVIFGWFVREEMDMERSNLKKCFVITPIGGPTDSIRRHIDGIIDQAITPALMYKFDIDVSHRKYEIGSINDKIIESIYKADLVIANLTQLNANVMFELAVRYCFGKPVIVIAEKGTNLPFDIIDQNTIFYINDAMGVGELRDTIVEFESNIDYDCTTYGPIYSSLGKVFEYDKIVKSLDNKLSSKDVLEFFDKKMNEWRMSIIGTSVKENSPEYIYAYFSWEELNDTQKKCLEVDLSSFELYPEICEVKFIDRGIILGVVYKKDGLSANFFRRKIEEIVKAYGLQYKID